MITGSLDEVNNVLGTLTDTDSAAAPDTIQLRATDELHNAAAPASIAVTVQTLMLNITAPASAVIGQGLPTAIGGVSLSETGALPGEMFTVTLSDINPAGSLFATGAGVSGFGTTLTINGSLAEVNADLATLTETETAPGSDTITVNASDSLNNHATPATIATTTNGLPVITAPAAATVNQGLST